MSDTTLEKLQVMIEAELEPYKREINKLKQVTDNAIKPVQNKVNGLKSMLVGLGKVLAGAFIVKKAYDWTKYSTQTALEVSAAMNQIKRTMGESTQSFLKWASGTALAFNIAKADAVKYGSVFSNLFSGFIKDQEQLTGYTVKMLETSAVVASATGRTMEDVMNRIRSGMLGSTEAIEDLGINVNIAMIKSTNAFKQMSNGMKWEQLDFQTQQAIRMMAIMEQASTKFGNTLMKGPATSLATFTALMKNAALNLGNAFLPVIQAVTPFLVGFARVLNQVTGALATFMQLLFGKKASVDSPVSQAKNDIQGMGTGLEDASKGADGLGKDLGGAGKKAKALKKELLGLMGFDEINLLNKKDDSDSGSSGGSGSGAGGLGGGVKLPKITFDDNLIDDDSNGILKFIEKLKKALEYLKDLLNRFGDGFKNVFHFEGIDRITNALKGIVNSIADIFADGSILNSMDSLVKQSAYTAGQIVGTFANVGLGIGVLITESLNKTLQKMKYPIRDWIVRNIDNARLTLKDLGNVFEDLGDIAYDVLTSDGAIKITSSLEEAFTYAFMTVVELITKFTRDMMSGVARTIRENKDKIKNALSVTLEAVAPIFETLARYAKDSFEGVQKAYDNSIKPIIDQFWESFSKLLGLLLDGYNSYILPVITEFSEKFKAMYDEYVKTTIDSFFELIQSLTECILVFWEDVLMPVLEWIATNIMPVLAPIIDFIGSFVIDTISRIMATLKLLIDMLSGVIEFIVGVFTGDWEKAWGGISKIWNAVWEFIKNILTLSWNFIRDTLKVTIEFITNIFIAIWKFIKDILGKIWGKISSIFNQVSSFIYDIWNGIWGTISGFVGDIWDSISSTISKVPGKFGEIFNRVKTFLSNFDLWSVGRDIISGLINGIGSMASAVWNKAKSIASGIGSAIKGFFGINSPSKLMKSYGGFIGQGLYLGIDKEEENVLNSAKGLSKNVIKGINSTDYKVNKGVEVNMFGSIKEDFANMMSTLVTSLGKNESSSSGDVIIQIGDAEFGRFAINKINEAQRNAGTTLLQV